MSSTSKIAVITAASLGLVLTQSSASRAETENSSAPEKVTRIAAPIDVDEEILYSALPDEVLEKAAGFGRVYLAFSVPTECLKKPASSSSKKPTRVKK
jgi:hypothetical protein